MTWDPRKGEDYSLRDHVNGRTFSNLITGHVVIEIRSEIEASRLFEVLRRLLASCQGQYFFSVRPWHGAVREYLQTKLSKSAHLLKTGPDVIGSFQSIATLNDLEIARNKCGGRGSGEWLFGCCSQEAFAGDQRDKLSQFSSALDIAGDIEVLAAFAEMDEKFLLYKPRDGRDEIVKQVLLNCS